MAIDYCQLCIVVSLYGLYTAFGSAVGFVQAGQEPSAYFVIVFGWINECDDKLIFAVLCQMHFCTARRAVFDAKMYELFEVLTGDCEVDFRDFADMANDWLDKGM